MSTSTLSFVPYRYSINSFGGIDQSNPLIIIFPPPVNGKKKLIGLATGDQGTGKTNTIHALLYAFGVSFDFNLDNLVNDKDGTLKGDFEFAKDGREYKVKYTKTKFELLKKFTDTGSGDTEMVRQSDPKEVIKQLIGHVATSPMKLKAMNGAQQIKWLFEMASVPEDVMMQQEKLLVSLAELTKSKSTAEKNYKLLQEALRDDPMYLDWSNCEQLYKEVKTVEAAQTALKEAIKGKEKLEECWRSVGKCAEALRTTQTKISDIEAKIKELEQQLRHYNGVLDDEAGELIVAQEELKKHIGADKGFEEAAAELANISEYIVKQKQWEKVKEDKSNMDAYETLMQKADSSKDQLKQQLRDLVKKITPDIPGLEVVTEPSIAGDRAIGIYYNTWTPAKLCESDLFDLYLRLCKLKGINMVIIENVTSLGSTAIQTINQLAEDGVQVWVTQMKRGQQFLKIEFVDEIK